MDFLAWPLSLRLAIVFAAGLFVGSAVNWAIYRLAWNQRAIGPWSPRAENAKPSSWFDWLPVIGWITMRRDAAVHGRGFWIRPMLLELATAGGFVAIYWWEAVVGGLLPVEWRLHATDPSTALMLHTECFVHLVLFSFMMAATWIDIDEKTIPDSITIPGTLLGMLLIGWMPMALLPHPVVSDTLVTQKPIIGLMGSTPEVHVSLDRCWLFSPMQLLDDSRLTSPRLDMISFALPTLGNKALALALTCIWFWIFAILPRSWYTRHGLFRAMRLMFARLRRESQTYYLVIVGMILSAATVYFWSCSGGGPGLERWLGLLSSLVGMAFGASIVWTVRMFGKVALHREAMGFGDVTLMAMIGAYVGWQPIVLIFFLAPFAGIVVGIAQFIVRGEAEIPYGPFLCLATLATIACWATLWQHTATYFSLGWILPCVLFVCLSLMVVLLPIVRWALNSMRRGEKLE